MRKLKLFIYSLFAKRIDLIVDDQGFYFIRVNRRILNTYTTDIDEAKEKFDYVVKKERQKIKKWPIVFLESRQV